MTAPTHFAESGAVARRLADRIDSLARDLLPGGHREGAEWRCGSITGEAGHSLGVRLTGAKRGVWCDFATGQRGDALDLVRIVLRIDMADAIAWARHWLDGGPAEQPRPPGTARAARRPAANYPDRWRRHYQTAQPIVGTPGERYLIARGLRFPDPDGRVLRYTARRWRRHPDTGTLEDHPAVLALLSDIREGEPCGVINIFLRRDGTDRVRDAKGKTVTGSASGAAVMLDPHGDVTMGLTVAEGVETGLALSQAGLGPVWALGGAGNLRNFPVLGGIEALTIAADSDDPGRRAAAAVAARWRDAGREVAIIAPPAGDWAEPRRDRA